MVRHQHNGTSESKNHTYTHTLIVFKCALDVTLMQPIQRYFDWNLGEKKIKFSFLPRNQEGCITLTLPLRLHTSTKCCFHFVYPHTYVAHELDHLSKKRLNGGETPLDEWNNVHIGFNSRRNCLSVERDPDLIWMLNEDSDWCQYRKTNGPILSSLRVSLGFGP